MLSKLLRWTVGVLGCAVLFPALLFGIYAGIAILLWLCVYGDQQGGRWAPFGWPVAVAFAGGASALFLLRVGAGRRVGWRVVLAWVVVLSVTSLAWLTFAIAVLLPPL